MKQELEVKEITRIEIIDETGRIFVRTLDNEKIVTLSQDGGKTIKIFIKKEK